MLDRHDVQILSLLNENPRLPASELGESVFLSRTAVSRRLAALKDAGVFAEYPEILSYSKLGLSVHAFVELTARDQSPDQICESLLQRPEVLRIQVVTGKSLFLIEVVAIDFDHLGDFMKSIQGFGTTETKVVFSERRSEMNLRERLELLSLVRKG